MYYHCNIHVPHFKTCTGIWHCDQFYQNSVRVKLTKHFSKHFQIQNWGREISIAKALRKGNGEGYKCILKLVNIIVGDTDTHDCDEYNAGH